MIQELPLPCISLLTLLFQHFMSEFGLSDSPNPDGRLLSQEHIFDIFLNDTSKPSIHPNTSWPILPLDPPDTLLELFQSISSRPHTSPNSPFFSYCPAYQYEKFQIILEKAHSCFQQQPTLYISAQHVY